MYEIGISFFMLIIFRAVLIIWGRYGFDRGSLSSGCVSRLRLVKRKTPLTGKEENNFALAAA